MSSPIMIGLDDRDRFLAAYDEQLRTDAETLSALAVTALGPLRLVTFTGGRGFVTYQDLDGADADAIVRLVEAALAHYQADPEITQVEWKTRGTTTPQDCTSAFMTTGSSQRNRSRS